MRVSQPGWVSEQSIVDEFILQENYVTVGFVTMQSNHTISEPPQAVQTEYWQQTPLRMNQSTVRELDAERRRALASRGRTLENLGENLFSRLDFSVFPAEGNDYRRYKQEITNSENSITTIREAVVRIRELDEEIAVKKQESADREEELAVILAGLGRELLDGDNPAFSAARRQRKLYLSRKETVEEQLQDLEDSPKGGIFTWFGALIKAAVLRSSLKKCGQHLDRICIDAGRTCAVLAKDRTGESGFSGETALLIRDAVAILRAQEELREASRLLEGEKRKIGETMGFKGNPSRRIQSLEEQAKKSREELRELYLKLGENAASGNPALSALLTGEDRIFVEEAGRFEESAGEKAKEIEKIEAVLSIEKEKTGLVKLEKALDERRRKLAEDERDMAAINRKIKEARERIEKLYIQMGNSSSDEK
jgi:hypothetical protein